MGVVQIRANPQRAATVYGFDTVFDHIVKRLLHLIAIELKQWQIRTQLLFKSYLAVLKLRREKANRFFDDCVHIFWSELWPRWTDCFQELRDDRVESVDFGTSDINRLFKL